jgi:hypothetical protein
MNKSMILVTIDGGVGGDGVDVNTMVMWWL